MDDDSPVGEKGSVESILEAETPVHVTWTRTRFVWRLVALVLFLTLVVWLSVRMIRS